MTTSGIEAVNLARTAGTFSNRAGDSRWRGSATSGRAPETPIRRASRHDRIFAAVTSTLLLIPGCGGGGGGGDTHTYSIGGAISGLTASGLVLANGNDTVSPAVGATSFAFSIALASGSSYAVTIQAQPTYQACQVSNAGGQVGSAAVTNVLVTCSRAWTWVGGSSTYSAVGQYGTQGTAAAGNVPSARDGSVSWVDSAGNLWLFGGEGYDFIGSEGLLNDLWRYSPATGQWTWVSGSSVANAAAGVYGTLGTAAAGNVPGARYGSVSWTDSAGNLWLFGGYGMDSNGARVILGDLWRYSPGSGEWTWISGSNTCCAAGVYGTQGVAAAGNVPGARFGSVSWTDSAGNLWLFGGEGNGVIGSGGLLNDLWRYSPASGLWTWVSGSSTAYSAGVYGSQGVAAAGNMPSARSGSVSWIDRAGNLWLFGGMAVFDPSSYAAAAFNDLWRYSPKSGEWTWVSGSNTSDAPSEVYGTQGTAAAGNMPSARSGSVSWIDGAGNLWLFGGARFDPYLVNDLWRYSPDSGQWAWFSVPKIPNAGGVYGTQGVAASGNVPGARHGSVSWIDSGGNLWLFGGFAMDPTGSSGAINDLWVY